MAKIQSVSIRDIARASQVSAMTVSRVIRSAPCVALDTRERVNKVILRLGYRPHPFVNAFMTEMRRRGRRPRNAGNIAWLCGTRSQQEWETNPLWAGYLRGAREAALALGYTISVVEDKRENIDAERLTQIFRARGVCGVILPPLTDELDPLVNLDEFSFVRIGGKWAGVAWHKVMPDYAVNQHIIWRHLLLGNIKRVGLFVTSDHLIESQGNTLSGFLFNQQLMPASRRLPPCVAGSVSEMPEQFRQWRTTHQPDVVVTDCSRVSEWLAMQPSVGPGQRDPFLVHVALSKESDHGWAGIDLQPDVQGRCAVEILNGLLLRNETGPPESQQKVLLAGIWRNGATLPRALTGKGAGSTAGDNHFLRPHWYQQWTTGLTNGGTAAGGAPKTRAQAVNDQSRNAAPLANKKLHAPRAQTPRKSPRC